MVYDLVSVFLAMASEMPPVSVAVSGGEMLKITVSHDESTSILILEGKLVGPWVAELETSWQAEKAQSSDLSLDLGGVTFVDSDGRALLKRIHKQGGKLVAKGCLIRAIVAELTDAFSCEKKTSSSFSGTKLLIAFFLLAATAAQSTSAQQSAPLRLTLHDAVTLALRQNRQVQIAGIQTSQSVQDQRIARASLLPQAHGILYGMRQRQAAMLTFVDNFRLLEIGVTALIPFMFLTKKIAPQEGAAPAH